MQWYYTKNSEKQGPITESELQELAARDQLNPDDLVWHAGLSGWTKAVDIPGLLAPPPLASELASPELVQQNHPPTPNSMPDTTGDNTVKRVEKKRSYIRRHWDGDLSLAQSFWVNNFLINITVRIAMAVVEEMPHLAEENPQAYAIGVLLFVIASLPITIWQWIGLFRCAQRHIQEGISRGWANAAIVLLVLGVIGGTMAYIRDFPVYRELFRIVFNYATTYDYDISLANNNAEVRIDGGIGPGLTADVESLLREHSEIRTIHLNSQGGLIDEGRRLAVLIRKNWLNTYTSERCVSACTLAFLAGKQRIIKKDAVLGFHQYVVFESTGSTRQTEEEKDRDLMIKTGIDADFLERAYSTPHESMWSSTKEQLLDANVVTSVTEGTEYSKGKPIIHAQILPKSCCRFRFMPV